MKKIFQKISLFMMALVASLALGTVNVNAENQVQSMHVSPPTYRILLMPGEKYSDSIVVSNGSSSTRALKYELSIGSFSEKSKEGGQDDYGTVDHISVSSYNQMMEWITLEKTNGTVEPNGKDIIGFTINTPQNAPAGGQYATIIVKDVTDRDNTNNGNVSVQSSFQFASIIYAEVAGETKEEGSISENTIPSFLLNGSLTAESMVRNNGNVHTDAEYTLQVWPMFSNEEICTNEEKPETSLILPETERYHAQTCELPAVGLFRAKQTVKIFGETSVVEKTIVVCPLWLLFLIVFVLVALVLWIVMRVRSSKRGRRNQSED